MIYIHDITEIRLQVPSVVTIGKFDGFHRGHRKLLKTAGELREEGMQIVLFTFSRSPQMVMAGKAGRCLNTHEEKLRLAEEMGVDVLVEYPFTEETHLITAETFLRDILCGDLQAKKIVAGPDCAFGFERRGNIDFLRSREEEMGYQTFVVEKENYQLEPISSSRIREALASGHVEEANDMLGYCFSYEAEVVHGRHLGRSLGFPTINQILPEGKIAPEFGVYASETEIDGVWYDSITNIGIKPTIPGDNVTGIETSVFDFSGNLYNRRLTVRLLRFIRPERKYYSLDALKSQVERDKREVRDFLQLRKNAGR